MMREFRRSRNSTTTVITRDGLQVPGDFVVKSIALATLWENRMTPLRWASIEFFPILRGVSLPCAAAVAWSSWEVFPPSVPTRFVPANPQVIYVPVYSPTIVYAPPPTYVYSPAAPLIVFGIGVTAGIIIANNHCDWYYGGVYYGRRTTVVWVGSGSGRYPYYPPPPHYRPPPYYPPPGYRPPPPGYRPPGYPPPSYNPGRPTPYPANGTRPGAPTTLPANTAQRWQPDQSRMRATGGASTKASISTMEARGWSAGTAGGGAATTRPANGAGAATTRPANGGAANLGNARPTTTAQQPARNGPAQPTPRPSVNAPGQSPTTRPSNSPGGTQLAQNQPVTRPAQSNAGQGSAFNGVGNGAATRDTSNRGAASRSGGQGGGGRSRGGSR